MNKLIKLHRNGPITMHKPTALQRLAQELKTFDWHHDPADKASKASKQEAKIRKIIKQCKEEDVRDLWDRVAPTSKFPAPFGLKPKKQPKQSKAKPGLAIDPAKAFQRRTELGLPDPSGEVERWQLLASLTRLADENGCTVHDLTNDQLKGLGKLKLYTPELKAEAERERLAYRSHSLQDPQVLEIIVGYVTEGTIPPDQLRKIYGEVGAMRVLSEVQRRVDSRVYEAVDNRDGKPTDSAKRGATKGSTMKTDKSNPTKNGEAKPRGGRYELFGQPVTATLRWMGKQGWDFAKARAALTKLGFAEVSDSTVRCQVGGWTYRGDPADLTAEQAAQVNEAGGGKASKGQKQAPSKAPNKAKQASEPEAAPKASKGQTAKNKAGKGPKQAPKAEAAATAKAKPSKAGSPTRAKQSKAKAKK